MFRKGLYFLLVLSVVLTVCGCSGKFSAGTVDEIKKQLKHIDAYQCNVRISITNNKSTADYVMKHYYKRPDKYRIEIKLPDELKGQTTIYNGKSAYIFHPLINQYLITENFNQSMEHDIFLGSFLERFEKDADARFVKEKLGDKHYFVMEYDFDEGSIYSRSGRIWFDIQTATPWKSEIYDKDGKTTAQVQYDNFEINPRLAEELFAAPEVK